MCFKSSLINPCNDTDPAVVEWVALIDEMYELFNKTIVENDLNLEFILDGDDIKNECFKDKW